MCAGTIQTTVVRPITGIRVLSAMTVNRRTFFQTSGVATLAGPAFAQSAAPSDRLGIAIVGCGGMGRMDLTDFAKQPDVEIRAVCDAFRPAADQARQMTGGRAEPFSDFRRVLERKDIDAVVIATPDHWHALMMIMACEAGKDVYVEKPISHNVREGRLMVEAARRHNRVAQVGIQQRSGAHFQRAVKAVQDGRIGDVRFAQVWNHNYSPDRRGMGFPDPAAPPAGLDWDLWLGPAPRSPTPPPAATSASFGTTPAGADELVRPPARRRALGAAARRAGDRDVLRRQVALQRLPRVRRHAGGPLGVSGQPAGALLDAGAQQLWAERPSGE